MRAEISGFLLATAGKVPHARTAALAARERVEHECDRVIARVGQGDEAEVAKLRLGSGVLVQSAAELAEKAGRYASRAVS